MPDLSITLIHFTWEGHHFYQALGDCIHHQTVLADGEPVPEPAHRRSRILRAGNQAYDMDFMEFDHAITRWQRSVALTRWVYRLNPARTSPFAFELPATADHETLTRLADEHGLDYDSVGGFYHDGEQEHLGQMVEALEVVCELDLGEVPPMPNAPFEWRTRHPMVHRLPLELWHTLPCETNIGAWIEKLAKDTDKLYYDSSKGSLSYLGGAHSQREVLSGITADNLTQLVERVAATKADILAWLERAKIERTCPTCGGKGVVGHGELRTTKALKQLDEAIIAVCHIRTGRGGRDDVAAARAKLEALRGYLVQRGEGSGSA